MNALLNADQYRGPQVCFDRPEMSPCLESIDDPDGRAEALAIIQAGRQSLEQLPRADMPGFSTLHSSDEKRRAHYEKYRKTEQQMRAAIRNGTKLMDSPETDNTPAGL